jgi:hypothetical protein
VFFFLFSKETFLIIIMTHAKILVRIIISLICFHAINGQILTRRQQALLQRQQKQLDLEQQQLLSQVFSF